MRLNLRGTFRSLAQFFGLIAIIYIALFSALFTFTASARDFPDVPENRVEVFYTQTREDGVDLKIQHLSNPGGPPILLMHGFGAQGLSLEVIATNFYNRGYDVYIGNVRGSTVLPEGKKVLADENGLEPICLYDFPAILRVVISKLTPQQRAYKLTLFGHSRGGMEINAMLSDPDLRKEFIDDIRAAILLQSPGDIAELKWYLEWLAEHGKVEELLRFLNDNGVELIDHHSRFLSKTKEIKKVGGFRGKVLIPFAENVIMQLANYILSPSHTGRDMLRRAVYKMSAEGIPTDELYDFLMAKKSGGVFYKKNGDRLIKPEVLKDLPYMFIASALDTLAPLNRNRNYLRLVASKIKQFMVIDDHNHTGSILSKSTVMDFIDEIDLFIRNPHREAIMRPEFVFTPKCESLLTKAKYYFGRWTRVWGGV